MWTSELACTDERVRLLARVARAWTSELACSGEAAGAGCEGVARMWIGCAHVDRL